MCVLIIIPSWIVGHELHDSHSHATEKYGHEYGGTRSHEWLCCRDRAAIYTTLPKSLLGAGDASAGLWTNSRGKNYPAPIEWEAEWLPERVWALSGIQPLV
jgi:hypothetical protein